MPFLDLSGCCLLVCVRLVWVFLGRNWPQLDRQTLQRPLMIDYARIVIVRQQYQNERSVTGQKPKANLSNTNRQDLCMNHRGESSSSHGNYTLGSHNVFSSMWPILFCWRLLGLIPGGTPFSQLNKDVRDVMSATRKRDVQHQVCTKTCKRPQVPTSSKHRKEGRVSKGAKKRAPVKSKGKHLCQSGKI